MKRPNSREALAYPAGTRPSVDPKHIASAGLRFSGVAQGANFLSLTQGRLGTRAGSPSFAIDGVIGPAFNAIATTDASSFSGQSTANDATVTLAVILRFNALGATQTILGTSSANNGWRIYATAGSTLAFVAGGVAVQDSGISISAGVPYLFIVSINASVANYLVRNLHTGKVVTASSASASPAAPNGTYLIGTNSFSECANAKIAAVMISARYMSLWQMRQWAADPWLFWYPRTKDYPIAVAAVGGGFIPAWAMNSNLPVIGTGTH
jgi:hypothetical protein